MADGSGEAVALPASGVTTGLGNGAGGTSAQPSNPLSRKLHKILETRLDNDKEMLEALKALSTFFVENSLRTRRNLRGDIERRSLAINEEFVSIFKEVKEELESINEDVQAMNSCCQDMTSRLQVRIEQVIVAEPGAVLLYKISNLLKFYHHTISGIVGNSATTLLTTIEEMHLLSKKIFFNSLSLHASKLIDKVCLKNAVLKL
uniref:Conserved oligomeric Golgi complex subunit 6 n=1 Tax=Molossus molossus TaxID=27622 RepID=A0A7J8GKC7_MOLMO|nr:component of oligomeric golgi complex 6 [Molossus molossus]